MTIPDSMLPIFEEAAERWLLAGEYTAHDLAVRVFAVCKREGVELRPPRRRPARPALSEPPLPPEPAPRSPLTPKACALPDDARRIALDLAARSEPR